MTSGYPSIRWLNLRRLATLGCVLAMAGAAHGGLVTLAGTGASSPFSANVYLLKAKSGERRGSNLLFTFDHFDLDPTDTATFSGSTAIQNILARVTSGISTIDGTIQCTIPQANFYLIDPSGVVFGPGAKLNVQGSFAVASANQIKLANGAIFGAHGTSDAALLTAAPAAFGFLKTNPQPVSVSGTTLRVRDAQSISLIGGGVTIAGGQLRAARGGQIAISSLDSAGSVKMTGQTLNPLDISQFSNLGTIKIATNSTIDANGPGGGRIVIQGGDMKLHNSLISSATKTSGNGEGIQIRLEGSLITTNSTVRTQTRGLGTAGNVDISAPNGTVDIEGSGGRTDGLATDTDGRGNAGNVNVKAADFRLADLAEIDTQTESQGAAGNAIISVTGNATLDQEAVITASTFGAADSQRVGSVKIFAQDLDVLNGAMVDATNTVEPPATGGNIVVRASRDIVIASQGQLTALSADLPAGNVLLHAGDQISISDASVSAGSGTDGGNVKLQTPGTVLVRDNAVIKASGGKSGGNIGFVQALLVLQNSQVNADGGKQGGNITSSGGFLLQFDATPTATGATPGTIAIDTPDPDVAGAIVALQSELATQLAGLEPTCAQMTSGSISSFVQTGDGGLPPEPGGFLPLPAASYKNNP